VPDDAESKQVVSLLGVMVIPECARLRTEVLSVNTQSMIDPDGNGILKLIPSASMPTSSMLMELGVEVESSLLKRGFVMRKLKGGVPPVQVIFEGLHCSRAFGNC